MNQNMLHVSLGADGTQDYDSAVNKQVRSQTSGAGLTLKGLPTHLYKLRWHFRGALIRLCQNASKVDFCLQHDLRTHGLF